MAQNQASEEDTHAPSKKFLKKLPSTKPERNRVAGYYVVVWLTTP